MTAIWRPDVLGDPFEQQTLALAADDEGPVTATLVRRRLSSRRQPIRAVLYLHGWSDYFFQKHLAEYWVRTGAAFYAVDLRKYGRSLHEGQTPGFTTTLTVYDEDIAAALAAIRAELPASASVMLMGHSTGGLIASLWAHRHPGEADGLVLNSPWLESQGSALLRNVSMPGLRQMARLSPMQVLPNVDLGFYSRTVDKATGGEWEYDPRWRPTPSFPARAAWLSAIMQGHAEVAAGLQIGAPALVLTSARTRFGARWSEQMRTADVVLETDQISARAVRLGPVVTVVRIDGGLHDLVLSAPPVREHVFAEITRWAAAYGWSQA